MKVPLLVGECYNCSDILNYSQIIRVHKQRFLHRLLRNRMLPLRHQRVNALLLRLYALQHSVVHRCVDILR